MINGEVRNQIDRIWDAFWSGGISNPLEVIEQITLTMIRELRIPNPPIELQRIFARRVSAIEKLKSLHRASRGEL